MSNLKEIIFLVVKQLIFLGEECDMIFLPKVADDIVKLVDSHGEIIDCQVESCQICAEIKYKRSLIYGEFDDGRKYPSKYYYLIKNLNTNEQKEFRTQALGAEFLKISVFEFRDLINKKLMVDGIEVIKMTRNQV